ncbi:19126_t:CDS:2, partial [Racocetra persica]
LATKLGGDLLAAKMYMQREKHKLDIFLEKLDLDWRRKKCKSLRLQKLALALTTHTKPIWKK